MLNFFKPAKSSSPAAPPPSLPTIIPQGHSITGTHINNPGVTQPDLSPLTSGTTDIKDIIAPPSIEVDFSHLKIGSTYFRTLFVAGYPRYVSANWLSPLINFDHSLDVSMFIYPVDVKGTLEQLRRRIAEMEAEISADIERGRIPQASTQAQLEDAQGLQEQLVKGIERFFQFSLYISITAETLKELDTITKQVQSLLGSLIIVGKIASLSQEDAFKGTLPYCKDRLLIIRNMDTTALSTTFPFTSSELSDNQGVLYGINEHNESLVIFDRFSLENANMLVLATSGAGKSVSSNETVLVKNAANEVKRSQIGPLIEKIIKNKGIDFHDDDLEGKTLPGYKVWTFNPQTLKGNWSPVVVAARKPSPNSLYKFTTQSGREITTTGDHNLMTLKNAQVVAQKSSQTKIGDALPLPRQIIGPQPKLSNKKLAYYTLLGYYTAEGCISHNQVYLSNTSSCLQKHILKLVSQLGFKARLMMATKENKIRAIIVSNKIFSQQIKLDKCSGYAHQKRAPATLFKQNNQAKAAYLRAYFDGDGCVEQHEITATTKSKDLASDLSYLLYHFGIVARLHSKFKRATNSQHQGDTYYQLTISGQDNLEKFAQHIGFRLKYKHLKLQQLLTKVGNSNVDIIPNLQQPLKQIYNILYHHRQIGAPKRLIEIKNGMYHPSRTELLKLIDSLQPRIQEITDQEKTIYQLLKLPQWQDLAEYGARHKKLNRVLWQQLGQTWRLFKNKQVRPQINTVLQVYQTTHGQVVSKEQIYSQINSGFQNLGLSLPSFDSSLHQAITQTGVNTLYDRITAAGRYLLKQYVLLQDQLKTVKDTLSDLKKLALSDLFWDPITKIEKLPATHPYVYDLTVNNEVFLAGYGGLFIHNSYSVKLEILRSIMFGTEVIVVDPENEYEMLCKTVGGNYIAFSVLSEHKINPFQLPSVSNSTEDEMSNKFLFLTSLLKIMMGALDPTEDAILNRALVLTYRYRNITSDPSTHKNPPPRMEDLYKALVGMEEPQAMGLAARLEKYIKGSLKGIFDQDSNVEIGSAMTVFTLRELADEIRPIVMFIILDHIWTKIRKDLKRRLLIVDEAWYLMRYEDSAKVLQGFVKRARKYYLGVTIISQNADDFLNSPYGKAIVTNSALQFLMKQSSAAIDDVAAVFYLSQGERHLLLSANVGEGLFFAGQNHVALRVVSSPDEHALVTSKPQEILARQEAARVASGQQATSTNF